MPFTEDLSVFVNEADFAVPVVLGTGGSAVTTTGIEDVADDVVLGDDGRAEVVGRIRTVLVKTADVEASGITDGSPVTVNGTARRARELRAEGDGAFTLIALAG